MSESGIVIAGGGFAGVWAALAARRELGQEKVPVTVINRDPYLVMRPRLYEADPQSMRVALHDTLAPVGVDLVLADIDDIDINNRRIATSQGALGYQRLVIALGSQLRPLPVPGAEFALDVDTYDAAVRLDQRLRAIGDAGACIAVVGAGFTGIEFATELRSRAANAEIVVIDNAPVVGRELGANPRGEIERALQEARVTLWLNTRIEQVDAGGLTCADGRRLDAAMVVNCTGLAAHPLAARVCCDADEFGRARVDDCLRVPDAPDTFAAGDVACAQADDAGHVALMSCQHAMYMGRFAGHNAACELLGRSMRPYRQENYVTCLDLGASGAVFTQGWDRQVAMTGSDANALKRQINTELIYPPTSAQEILEKAALPSG